MGAQAVPSDPREALRTRMESGSLNLLGVAAALRVLGHEYDGHEHKDLVVILDLLARDVDLEADAMSEVEAFFNGCRVRAIREVE